MPKRSVESILEQKEAVIVEADTSVTDVAKHMTEHSQGAALVVRHSKIVGIITEADIIHRVIAEELDPLATRVTDVMSKNPIIIKPDRPFGQALYLMHEYGVHYIPVVDKGKPLGVVCAADAIASDLQEFANDAVMLDHIAEIL